MLVARKQTHHVLEAGLRRVAYPAWLLPAGLTLAAFLLRLVPFLAGYPLHRDEALYGFWARLIAFGHDPLLLTPWIDKPPLALYLMAGSLRLFGVSDMALRAPGMLASVLTVPALYSLAARVYGRRVGLLAAGLWALSPFAILFAPTAFTDPWLVLWLVLAARVALAHRPFLAGLLAALAIASKQQGVCVVPLVLALLMTGDGRRRMDHEGRMTRAGRLTTTIVAAPFGFALIFGPLTYWDSLRWHNRPSFWDQSLNTYNPLTIAPLAEWPARLAQWLEQAGYWFGHPAITAAVVALAAGAAVIAWRAASRAPNAQHPERVDGATRRARGRRSKDREPERWASAPEAKRTRSEGPTLLFAAYTAGLFAAHVIVTFQPWDRYLLPLLPLVCLLAARGLAALLARTPGPALPLVCAAALGLAAAFGVLGRLPVGSDHGAYTGLQQVVGRMRDLPADAVIYQHALGWHFDYYLFDAPQERRWFGSGWQLADATAAFARQGRAQWVVLPAFELEWAEAARLPLAGRGLGLHEAERVYRPDGSLSFVLYRVAPL